MAAVLWKIAGQTYDLTERAMIMGVLNVTPDSFSDGGQFFNADAAVEQGTRMIAEGADIIDIGGESTRPGADEVPEQDELARVLPIIERLQPAAGEKLISIDTMKAGVARAALREPNLPAAEHTHASREVKLLVDHREDLVNTRTQVQNRLRWHLHELDPTVDPAKRSLDRTVVLNGVTKTLEEMPPSTVRRVALELVEDVRMLTTRINALERELRVLVREQAPQLLTLSGCGVLTAAKLIGETANPTRFRSEACFAMHAGVAPIPASSGRTSRHRLARGGNRQLNCSLHRIAVTQIRLDGPGRAYYLRRITSGDTKMEALRALKRRLARVVFTLLQPTHNSAAALRPLAA